MNEQFEQRLSAIEYELSQIAESEYLEELKEKFSGDYGKDVVVNIIPSRDVSFKTRSLLSSILDRLELSKQDRLDLEKYIVYGGGDNIEYLKQILAIWVEWKDKILNILKDAPEEFDSLIEIFNYINDHIIESNVKFNDIPFEKGSGENSAVLKDGNNIVNQKAYRIASIDPEDRSITLSSANGLSVGDIISMFVTNNYYNFGSIISIKNNAIFVSQIPSDLPNLTKEDYLFVLEKPEVGDIQIADYGTVLGYNNKVKAFAAEASGYNNVSFGKYSHTEGQNNEAGYSAHAEGWETQALESCSHSEGRNTQAIAPNSHSEGKNTIASGNQSHVEGSSTQASEDSAHAEGSGSKAQGFASHAEGESTAIGRHSHSEGRWTKASGNRSHAEGESSEATASYAHAEGYQTKATANQSHSEGQNTLANGTGSHAEGVHTITNNNGEHASGMYNVSIFDKTIAENTQFSVGIGTSEDKRKNAFEVKQNGDVYIAGIGEYNGTNVDTAKSVQEVINELVDIINQITIKVEE